MESDSKLGIKGGSASGEANLDSPDSSLGSRSRRRAFSATGVLALAAMLHHPTTRAAKSRVETRKPQVGAFAQVFIDVPADVKIRLGSATAITLTAEPHVLDAIKVTVANNRLSIQSAGSFQTQRAIVIDITATMLEDLEAQGSCDVTVNGPIGSALALRAHDASNISLTGLNLSSLLADLQGSSEVQAAGSTTQLKLTATDASNFDGSELTSDSARLEVSGASEASIDVQKALTVIIDDAGSVFYSGSPNIDQTVSVAGTLETL